MSEKRFSIKEGSSIGLSSIYTDNGKVMTQLEVLDVLIKQHETIQNLNQRIDDYLTEVNYQLEQGTDFKDTYVRYSRFKQILEELKGVLNND